VGVGGSEVGIVVLVPGIEVVPERMPETTAAGNLSMPKLSRAKRAAYYKIVVCGHLLATETCAVAPGITSVRAAVIRMSDRDAYGKLAAAQDDYATAKTATAMLDEQQRARIRALATDFPALWNNPATPMRERKRLIRLLITDVTLTRGEDTITAAGRLPGGQSTTPCTCRSRSTPGRNARPRHHDHPHRPAARHPHL
jgi:hypothetical protein